MAIDPYAALGLTRSATEAEIKAAYRRIAKADHPDLNPDPKAADRFKAAAAAHDLLKDPDQRRRFDAGEIDAQGQESAPRRTWRPHAEAAGNPYARDYGFGADPDLSDVFSDLFGARRAGSAPGAGRETPFHMRGPDHRFALTIDFLTAARGGKTRITLPDGADLEVTIPRGARDGQTIRLTGRGGAGVGQGGPGDAYLTLAVAPHPDFVREGDDIHVTLPISLDEAILGGKVQAPTIDGPVAVTVPAGASSGRKLRLRGRGVNGGDQHITLQVAMPPRIDDDLRRFIEGWRDTHGYDPRGNTGGRA